MSGRGSRWYDDAVIYAIDVEAFQDADDDGVGDFEGLIDRLDYLDDLGVDCLWLLPFYPTPNRDNGYDVADYYGVDPHHGTLGDFVDFVDAARRRDLEVLIDLVVNHTSDQHPWFQRAREDPDSKYRDYYVWSRDQPEPNPDRGSVFPGEVAGNRVWTFDTTAGAYYYHRFYPFQPDLDLRNPDVREEIRKIVRFWLRLGVSGFRIDAAGLMTQEKRPGVPDPVDSHEFLRELKAHARRYEGEVVVDDRDAVLMAEADDEPGELASYFGRGDEMDLLLNFVLDAYLFLALAAERGDALERGLGLLPAVPEGNQWVNFLRNYDELNVGRLSEADREVVFERFAPDEDARIYGRGIRRRLAPMLDGDQRWLELAFSLLFSMPGAPMLVHGDEIGMGDDLTLPGRTAVRTPMQWSSGENAGFSGAAPADLVRPVIDDGPFSHERVNVADQRDDADSLLSFVRRLIDVRHELDVIGAGEVSVLETAPASTFAHRFDREDEAAVFAHNLGADPAEVALDLDAAAGSLSDPLGTADIDETDGGTVELVLDGHGYQWLQVEES